MAENSITQDWDGLVTISKPSFGSSAKVYYSAMDGEFFYHKGTFVEFRSRVVEYTNSVGLNQAPNVWLGEGITLYFSDTKDDLTFTRLHLGYFDCGSYGKKIGIFPGNGSADDILKQTALGRTHSASTDWTAFHTYRLIYLPNNKIEVWIIGDNSNYPILSIPWADYVTAADPLHTTPPTLAYGCVNPEVAIKSEWQFVRYGMSSGHEVELSQDPTIYGLRDVATLFDGAEVLLIDVEDAVGYYHRRGRISEAVIAATSIATSFDVTWDLRESITADTAVSAAMTPGLPAELATEVPI
jgi:hypothetical protein